MTSLSLVSRTCWPLIGRYCSGRIYDMELSFDTYVHEVEPKVNRRFDICLVILAIWCYFIEFIMILSYVVFCSFV